MNLAKATGLRGLRRMLGIDRAVGFTVLARSWSILGGLINVVFIAHFLSPAEQGYYYTFASLIALQTVFELGFSFVILQLAAHETAQLHISPAGDITGSEIAHARLASILQKSVRWYSVAALLMVSGLLAAGLYFFSVHQNPAKPVPWMLPWICVAVATTFTFQMDPVFSFLEGCGFVSNVAHLRLCQAMTGSLLAWLAFLTHHGLFAPAGLIMGQAAAGSVFLFSRRRMLLPLLRRHTHPHAISWTREVWSFQWRMAVSFLCSYFILPLFNPVLFAYQGAVVAGRMGMSTTIAAALGTVAYSWVYTKVSPFGNMIAKREYDSLDRLFGKALRQSAALLFMADTGVFALLLFTRSRFPHLATRVLPPHVFALILLTTFLLHIYFCEAVYLRAHKREPFLVVSVVIALLTAASTLIAGRYWGAAGIAAGYFVWSGIFQLILGTWIFLKKRRQWHSGSSGALASRVGPFDGRGPSI